jgi:hypothetical protein
LVIAAIACHQQQEQHNEQIAGIKILWKQSP